MRVYVIEHKTAVGGYVVEFATYNKREHFRRWNTDPEYGSGIVARRRYVVDRPPIVRAPAKKRSAP